MRISYRFEPPMMRFWIGATDGTHTREFALQHWMDVDDVIDCLKKKVEELNEQQEDV